VTVLDYALVHDSGTILDYLGAVVGQRRGVISHGLGGALHELLATTPPPGRCTTARA
jgi:CO/xanthine dehydrogenase Mo-binding subunit